MNRAGDMGHMNSDSTQLLNHYLIALPNADEMGVFTRSVALICQHDHDGAMGIVVNRPSELTVGEVFDQLGIDTANDDLRSQMVLQGGPVHAERGFVLHDGGMHWDSSLQISENLFLTTSREVLEALGQGQGPSNALIALGCAAWGHGQLENELTENVWLTAPADSGLLFNTSIEMRWQAAAGRIGVDFAHLTDYAGHA